jgi:hypothetical protein
MSWSTGPCLAGGGLAAHRLGREGVDGQVVGRMDGDAVALAVGRELGDLKPVAFEQAPDLVAVVPALGRLREVEDGRIEGRDLHADIAFLGRPGGQRVEPVVGGDGGDELGEEDRRALDGAHQPQAALWFGAGGRAVPR